MRRLACGGRSGGAANKGAARAVTSDAGRRRERVGDTAQFDKHDRHGGKLDHDGRPTKEHPSAKSGEKADGSPVSGKRVRP